MAGAAGGSVPAVAQTGATVTLPRGSRRTAQPDTFSSETGSSSHERSIVPQTRTTFWQGKKYGVGILYPQKNGRVIRGKIATFDPPRRAGEGNTAIERDAS